MTNLTKISVALASAIVLVLSILSAAYIKNNLASADNLVKVYQEKREELIIQQQSLKELIETLNQTIQNEQVLQENISKRINELSGQSGTGTNQNNQSSSPTITPPSTPKQTTPRPVTRAS